MGTDQGEILFCDQNCEFKFMLADSPRHNFRINHMLPIKGEDFMIADGTGAFYHYESTGELRNPFKLFKSNLPTSIDQEDNTKWTRFLEDQQQDGMPYFPITGMEQLADHLVFVTNKKQILKMRI